MSISASGLCLTVLPLVKVSLLPDQCTMQYSTTPRCWPPVTDMTSARSTPSGNPVVITCGFRRQRAREAVQGRRRGTRAVRRRRCLYVMLDSSGRRQPLCALPACAGRRRAGWAGSGVAAICPLATLVRFARKCLYAAALQPSPLFANPCRHHQSFAFDRATTLVPKPQVRWARGVARANEPHLGVVSPSGVA